MCPASFPGSTFRAAPAGALRKRTPPARGHTENAAAVAVFGKIGMLGLLRQTLEREAVKIRELTELSRLRAPAGQAVGTHDIEADRRNKTTSRLATRLG